MLKSLSMQDVVKARIFFFLAGIIIVPIATIFLIMFARGFRPDFEKKEFLSTGLLVAHSYPESAQVYIDGQLKTATDATLNLPPGQYLVEIKKEGFQPWKKSLIVEPEVVTRATATLFPTVPSLKQITIDGASLPTLSPDGSKVAYTSPDAKKLYILDLNESPLGLINRDPKLLTTTSASVTQLQWSPDSRQLLAQSKSASGSSILVDISSQQTRNASANLSALLASWQTTIQARNLQKFSSLPLPLQAFLATASADLDWSPRENKLLYTATASAQLPDKIIKQLPGSSTQAQERLLVPGSVYVYDLEEDRNFKVGSVVKPTPTPKNIKKASISYQLTANSSNASLHWLPTSSHLIRIDTDKITIFEYDGQNPTIVYAGPMAEKIAIPYPSAKQMLLFTNLVTTPIPGQLSIPNLYALTLR